MSDRQMRRGPGRPEVGAPIHTRVGVDLLARLDAAAARDGVSRAEMIRRCLQAELEEVPED